MSKSAPLGSAAVYSSANIAPQLVHVTPSTCQNLSLFKDLMREYRKLDDSVTMRLNRNTAQFRDRDREGRISSSKGGADPLDESCAYFWRELVANWERRKEIIDYCVDVVDSSIKEKRAILDAKTGHNERDIRNEMYSDEVKRNQIRGELGVEQIVRLRSTEVFKSRCKYFEPPLSDAKARLWWEEASRRA